MMIVVTRVAWHWTPSLSFSIPFTLRQHTKYDSFKVFRFCHYYRKAFIHILKLTYTVPLMMITLAISIVPVPVTLVGVGLDLEEEGKELIDVHLLKVLAHVPGLEV